MTTPVIIDAIVVVILVGFCLFGARRGLFQAFAGLVTMIVALVGAGIIAASFSGPVTGLVAPLIEDHPTGGRGAGIGAWRDAGGRCPRG